jgi:hypothetical protein
MKPPPGRVARPLGLLTANRWGSSNRTSKYCGESGSTQGGRFQTRVWLVQFLLPGLWGRVGVKACQVGEQGLSMVFAADDCGVGIAPVEHVV